LTAFYAFAPTLRQHQWLLGTVLRLRGCGARAFPVGQPLISAVVPGDNTQA
jgi:hypothetical protein